MNCLSWNIRGLESPDRKFVIKRVLNSFDNIDLVMLQEVKATGFNLETNFNFIWKDSIKFHFNHCRDKGGITILVNPKWGSFISDNSISPCNMAVWFIMNINNNFFGFCSIYAPSEVKSRISLWNWLANLPDIP